MNLRARMLSAQYDGTQLQRPERAHPSSHRLSLINYIYEEYGGLNTILNMTDTAINLASKFNQKNRTYQSIMGILKYGVPTTIMAAQFIKTIQGYREYINPKNDVHHEKEEKIFQLLGISENDKKSQLGSTYIDFGKDVVNWVFQRPKTENFSIQGFYEYEKLEKIASVINIESGNILIPLEFDKMKFVWDFSFSRYEKEMVVNNSEIHCRTQHMIYVEDLKNAIFKEFMKHFNIKENVLYFDGGLRSRKRLHIVEDINQFDVHKYAEEVRKVLERKKRRGYAFVGIPGVGKSSLLRKLESIITDYPFIYLSPNNFRNGEAIINTFNTLRYIQPCITILEDLDAFCFDKKNERLGIFLDLVDDVNNELNMVLIATINDTNQVHYSLINRPGRLDQVILVKPPSKNTEVYEVMKIKYSKEANNNKLLSQDFISFEAMSKNLFCDIIRNKLTQADICEIIEKALYLDSKITNEALVEGLECLLESKRAIKECNFNDTNPLNRQEDEDQLAGGLRCTSV